MSSAAELGKGGVGGDEGGPPSSSVSSPSSRASSVTLLVSMATSASCGWSTVGVAGSMSTSSSVSGAGESAGSCASSAGSGAGPAVGFFFLVPAPSAAAADFLLLVLRASVRSWVGSGLDEDGSAAGCFACFVLLAGVDVDAEGGPAEAAAVADAFRLRVCRGVDIRSRSQQYRRQQTCGGEVVIESRWWLGACGWIGCRVEFGPSSSRSSSTRSQPPSPRSLVPSSARHVPVQRSARSRARKSNRLKFTLQVAPN